MAQPVRTILVALDLGSESARVASWAETLAKAMGARVVALHVVVGLEDVVDFEFPYVSYEEDFADLNTKAAASLERFAKEHLKGVTVTARNADGKPARAILHAAQEVAADLIVVGTHEGRFIQRAVYGSPAQQVILKTSVPVVAVPLGLGEEGAPGTAP
ncbi:MAG: universal stress protein [Proteobacteria bacterium]|nr:universal stress protein [Pseudomonadota bacterium]